VGSSPLTDPAVTTVPYRDGMGGGPGEGSSEQPALGVVVTTLRQDRATAEAMAADPDEDKPWWGGILVGLAAVFVVCAYIVLKTPGVTVGGVVTGAALVVAAVAVFLAIGVFVFYFVGYNRRASYRESSDDWISGTGRMFGPTEDDGGLPGAAEFMSRHGSAYLMLTSVGFVIASTTPWRTVLACPFADLRTVELIRVERPRPWSTRLDCVVLTTRDDRRAVFTGAAVTELARRLRDLGATVNPT
jgi:hypothetical protein